MSTGASLRQRALVVVLACSFVAGCDSAIVTPGPTSSATAEPRGSDSVSTAAPGSSFQPASSFDPESSFDPAPSSALPEPTVTEPSDIGLALFQPGRVADGVVSLVAQMGIEVQDAAGNVTRPGTDIGVGRLVLTEDEVRGLIEIARDDLAAMDATGAGSVRIQDFYETLRPSLPPGYGLDDLVAGYSNAYAAAPDAFVPQVMLGQPVDPAYPLTRIQAWLLFIDGFLGSHVQSAQSVRFAAGTQRSLGGASRSQPPLVSQIPGMSDVEWAYLLSRLPTLAYTIPFVTIPPGAVHEGHGGEGQPATIRARVSLPPPLVFPQTGHVLLEPHASVAGITAEWSSDQQGTLARHGTLSSALLTPTVLDASGQMTIRYTPRRERADGRGTVVRDVASLYARVDAADLIRNVYFVAQSRGAIDAVELLARGKVHSRFGYFPIAWHEEDTYELTLRNKFDVYLDQNTGSSGGTGMPDLLNIHRVGRNEAAGVIYNNRDGTYRGTLNAWVFGSMDGKSFVGECHDQTDAVQALYVIGHDLAGATFPPYMIVDGTYDNRDLMLYFYPVSPPDGTLGPCQGTLEFPGGGPDDQPAGILLPFNDSRWTAAFNTTRWQDGIGLRIYLPKSGTLEVTDNRQMRPDLRVESQWSLVVTRPDGSP